MSIFDRRKKETPQVELRPAKEYFFGEHKYDYKAALAKSVMVFCITNGAVGGFLSAYELAYNRLACMAGLFLFALLMGFLYEIGVKALTNFGVIVVFVLYAVLAVNNFWVLNSGAYTVINKMYEVARSYLRVTGGSEYNLRVQDTYQTVTAIALFIGVVGIILITLRIQYSASFLTVFLMTFTLYLIPLYFEKTPGLLDIFFMLAGYLTLLMVQASGNRKEIGDQVKRALPIAVGIAAVLVVFLGVFLPQNRYRLMVKKNEFKAATEEEATVYAQYGMLAILQNSASGGGVSGGKLSRNGVVMPNYKTDLKVRFTPYSPDPVYLKAFAGLTYHGDRWSDVREALPEDDRMSGDVIGRKEWYEADPGRQGRGIFEVENIDASEDFDYKPYYTDESDTYQIGKTASYRYYPMVNPVEIRSKDLPDERYLQISSMCYKAVEDVCLEEGFQGTPLEIAQQIVEYFARDYTYTLRPGFYYGSQDFISYFLSKNKKGYCAHFASSATMLFRYLGIPARYVEGYAFSYTDMALDGKLLEEEVYEDYYSGYSPLGKTGVIEMEISDSQAHAWVEIYVEGYGWIVIDPTPAAGEEEEETGSFWEIFGMGAAGNLGDGGRTQGGLSEYLENAMTGSAGFLLLAVAVVFMLPVGKNLIRIRKEAKLPGKERVKLTYRRMCEEMGRKDRAFAVLTTPAEEITYLRKEAGFTVPEDLEETMYRILYAPETDAEYEAVLKVLAGIRRQIRYGKVRKKL